MYSIAIVGGGIIGFTSALSIQKEFKDSVNVHIYTDQLSPNTTADVSAGLWTPYLLQSTSLENVVKWSKATQDLMIDLMKEGHADEAGIILHPIVVMSPIKGKVPPEWIDITLGFHQMSQKEVDTINRHLKKNYESGLVYISVSMQATKLLPFLQKRFVENGGKITIKKINDFEELSSYDLIVNCSGLNAKNLTSDDQLVPIRGQVHRVHAPWLYYTFMADEGKDYIIINADNVVLGGTAQIGDYNTEVDEKDKETILNNCYEIIPSLKKAPIISDSVGLRPGRLSVRVELEIQKGVNKTLKIIHNYGHGGSGVTLSHGCSLDVVELAKEALLVSSEK